jgi:hypothetical protein
MDQTLTRLRAGAAAKTLGTSVALLLVLAGAAWLVAERMIERGFAYSRHGLVLVGLLMLPVLIRMLATAWTLIFHRGAALYVRDGRLIYLTSWFKRARVADVRGAYPVLARRGFGVTEYIRIDFASGRPVHVPALLIDEYVDVVVHRLRQLSGGRPAVG